MMQNAYLPKAFKPIDYVKRAYNESVMPDGTRISAGETPHWFEPLIAACEAGIPDDYREQWMSRVKEQLAQAPEIVQENVQYEESILANYQMDQIRATTAIHEILHLGQQEIYEKSVNDYIDANHAYFHSWREELADVSIASEIIKLMIHGVVMERGYGKT